MTDNMRLNQWSWRLLILCLAAMGCSSKDSALGKVRLTANPAKLLVEHDGEHPEIDVETEIQNVGRDDLSLVSVHSTCGCTVVREGVPKRLPAAGRFRLKLKVQPPLQGEIQVVVEVRPAEGAPLQIPIRLTGKPLKVPYVVRCPKEIQLIGSSPNRPVEEVLVLVTVEARGDSHWITGVESDNAGLTARIEHVKSEPLEPDRPDHVAKHYSIRLTAEVAGRMGEQSRTQLTFRQSQSTEDPPPVVYVMTSFEPPIVAIPQQLLVSRNRQNLGKQVAAITLIGDGAGDWSVKAIRGLPEGMSHRMTQIRGGVFRVDLEWDGSLSLPVTDGKFADLILETTHQECEQVVVPIHIH